MRCANCEYEMTFSDRLLHRTSTGYYCPRCWAVLGDPASAPKSQTTLPDTGKSVPSPILRMAGRSGWPGALRPVPADESLRASPPQSEKLITCLGEDLGRVICL